MSTVTEKQKEINTEALNRAKHNTSLSNYPIIFQGFTAMGIPETDIIPRENVFTFNAWKALKRQVMRGQHGVKVCTYIPMDVKDKTDNKTESPAKPKRIKARRMTTVFHISQTKAMV